MARKPPVIPLRETTTEGAPAKAQRSDSVVLTEADIASKSVRLEFAPRDPDDVTVTVVGGGAQFPGTDFQVRGGTITWAGLGLEAILEAGDKLIIEY